MDPVYAAKKFFTEMKKLGTGRDSRLPWFVAQDIQRSAYDGDPYPYGSNYQQYWDEAQAIFSGLTQNTSAGMDYAPGKGGWRKPSVPGLGWSNTHDYRAPIGTPIYAVSDGTIIESRAVTSGGSDGNGLYSTPYRSYGETIAMRTASGDIFRYAHLSPGTRMGTGPVTGGTMIGRTGNTGNSSGPHLHMDVNGNYDAMGWLRQHGVSLSKGAANIKWDNTIANLHKGEAVLTEDLNTKFKQGVDRFAEGPSSTYNVNMYVTEATVDVDELVGKTVTAIRRIEMRKPQSRNKA